MPAPGPKGPRPEGALRFRAAGLPVGEAFTTGPERACQSVHTNLARCSHRGLIPTRIRVLWWCLRHLGPVATGRLVWSKIGRLWGRGAGQGAGGSNPTRSPAARKRPRPGGPLCGRPSGRGPFGPGAGTSVLDGSECGTPNATPARRAARPRSGPSGRGHPGVWEPCLNLQPGELVEVKSEQEIRATLDEHGRHRGLLWMPGMARFCGKTYKVHKRVETIMLESTGELRKIRHTVLLADVMCENLYGCDRSCFHYWREAWLRRVVSESGTLPAGGTGPQTRPQPDAGSGATAQMNPSKPSLRILLISLVYPPEHAPAGIMTAELAHELARAGHEVTVLTGFPSHPAGRLFPGWKAQLFSRERTEGSFTLLRCRHSFVPRFGALGKMWYHFTFAASSFWAGLWAGRFDVLVLPSTPAFCGPAAILLAWIKKAKTFYWVHDIHPESAINAGLLPKGVLTAVMKAADSWVCRRADLVATITEEMREVLLARGLPAEHVVLQRHWLDEDRIRPSGPNGWRRKQGIRPADFVALHAGTLGYVSGAGVIVEAAKVLAHQARRAPDPKAGRPEAQRPSGSAALRAEGASGRPGPRILFLFVGDGPLKAPLQERAKEYGLTNVRFLPFQSEEDLNSMLASADVGLVTLKAQSAATSIPSKMHGYTSAGRPVIASVAPASAIARLIRAGGFGWAVPPADPEALAGAVLQAAGDAGECRRRGRKAREFFVSEFGRRVVVEGFRRKLETLRG